MFRDEVGKYISLGIAEGITDNGDVVSDALDGITNDSIYSVGTTIDADVNGGISSNSALDVVVNLLGQLVSGQAQGHVLSVNGRQFALATAGDMDYALGQLSRKESRR